MNSKPVQSDSNPQIPVTMPSLAPLEEYVELLRGVWSRGILTHNGPLVQQLEKDLCRALGLDNFVAVSNGTMALQMAIRALGLTGEIITTPFTWIATVSAIKWEGCLPVFCDIDPETLNIDPCKIEPLITNRTCAIMPVHVFGNPCDVQSIEDIAARHRLKVIYDGAHAVGSVYRGRSLLERGDITATSLHATKLLNTAEGGGCITRDAELHERLRRIRFFGHDDAKDIVEDGFNGKMTEVHAALGIVNLKYYDAVLADRKRKYAIYRDALSSVASIRFQSIRWGETNCSYFPAIFASEAEMAKAEEKLKRQNIHPRRYFHPSVNMFGKVVEYQPAPVSEDITRRILCLPLYYGLTDGDLYRVIDIVAS